MAEIQTATTSKKAGKPKRKQLSTRIDLTPMVDLGFLLITFFIFTTTLTHPSVMKLNLPEDGPPMASGENKTLNLVLFKDNKVGYYVGKDINNMRFTNYSASGIRREIEKMQNRVSSTFGNKEELLTAIKPTQESSYKNVVDVLDEMLITGVTRYVLSEADEEETKHL